MTSDKTAELLISQAIHKKATDIHITPRMSHYNIQFRIHDELHFIQKIPLQSGEKLISHLKFIASMDISERRKPQSGSFQSNITNLNHISFRISSLPTAYATESIVIRILPQNETFHYQQLALFPSNMDIIKSLMNQAHGLILFTGPTGSGKSSTMYSLAHYGATELNRHVITLEDPVEKRNDHLLQIQVNQKAGISYSSGLKAILRHDPDLILIGEIRDVETANIAIRAAMTGHLVLSSLHTRDAKGAIYRLLEFGVKMIDLEQTLLAIAAQRLVSILCPYCGMRCSVYCSHLEDKKRKAVFEILHGKALKGAMENINGRKSRYDYQTLSRLIRKGIALGYLSHQEYSRWIIEEEADEFKGSSTIIH